MWKIVVLGCGPSLGVPIVGCKCSVCISDTEFNKRLRSSLYLQYNNEVSILIDCGCDIRFQLLRANITKLDAVILTHRHSDHVAGIDNLRVFAYQNSCALDVYANVETIDYITKNYSYLFKKNLLNAIKIDDYSMININGKEIITFQQNHGEINSLGIRIKNFVYSNDVREFPEKSHQFLHKIDVWVLDCLQKIATDAHAGLDEIIKWNKKFMPKKIYLTNMNHTIDYYQIQHILPENVNIAYDGLKFFIE
ncbi:metallo-beta-lactamase superfamily protein [Orientia chuto str. Dubai]|uniref:Metallo-beta-lactamase superfamily protein n=1 Tax=Orientia chuto str. Dubai TaxID=1359168 RepID=A0A0F3MLN0_9RICK|nr:MBL fold metallo-hydrolase [Candidatus Orientia mediorientalis]KJV56551.1 metallo-beta-lactamase superfamily protein [Orientia chuto str. Dubai]